MKFFSTRDHSRIVTASQGRSLTVCPSVTLCAPCTHAGMVFLSNTSAVPTAVLKPRLRSCDKAATNSALLIGCESEETT